MRGVTIIELLIAFAIFTTVLVLSFQLMNPVLHHFNAGDKLADLQNQIIVAESVFINDMAESKAEWITNYTVEAPEVAVHGTLSSDPDDLSIIEVEASTAQADEAPVTYVKAPHALALPSARDTANNFVTDPGTGFPMWQKWIIYYLYPEPDGIGNQLVRKIVSGSFPPDPIPWTIPLSEISSLSGNYKIIAHNVSQFEVLTMYSYDEVPYFIVSLKLTKSGGQEETTIATQRIVYPRN